MSGATLAAYRKSHPKPKTLMELKEMLQSIWDSLPQEPIDKAVKEFRMRLKAFVAAGWTLWTSSVTVALWIWTSNVFWCRLNNVILCCVYWYVFKSQKIARYCYAAVFINSRQFKIVRSYWCSNVRLWCINKCEKFHTEILGYCWENDKKSFGDIFICCTL